jgi:hypothetical protein
MALTDGMVFKTSTGFRYGNYEERERISKWIVSTDGKVIPMNWLDCGNSTLTSAVVIL